MADKPAIAIPSQRHNDAVMYATLHSMAACSLHHARVLQVLSRGARLAGQAYRGQPISLLVAARQEVFKSTTNGGLTYANYGFLFYAQ
ncbi:hypothetical protein D0Y50_12290 [Salinimonas sediminis]|uniref:Uncharacterized protein n=1 Tax=Salinimonas sediminis TaxID=2303538 RepID=A0A346NNF3_9ALTE|nr:hypothetical protein D0Y50_12290 [Salinimonas sediminis]